MDRFIDDSGREVPISGVVEFARLLNDGVITAQTLIYDGNQERWFPARELPGFTALRESPPSRESGEPRTENGPRFGPDPFPAEDSNQSTQWKVLHDGNVIGPVPESEVVRMLREGRLPGDTKVQTAAMVWPLPANTLAPFRGLDADGEDDGSHTELTQAPFAAVLEEIEPPPGNADPESAKRSDSLAKKALLSVPALLSGPAAVLVVTFTVYDFSVVGGLGTMAIISFGAVRAVWSG